ncbi:MAG: carboxypeptidase regulatory-like domain-containing protein [Ignavibacteria bacterium]|nr:carboxypeptidase regulatory-like domain-containing protein [Ignavibacteria bacterium]
MKYFWIIIFICILLPESLFGINVEGRVIDEKYFPVPFITVSASSGQTAKTDKNGNFLLKDLKTPYKLFLYDFSNSTGIVYNDLSISKPELIFFGYNSSKDINTEILKVEFPQMGPGKSAILKFISDKIFYCKDSYISSGEKIKHLVVEWPSTANSITGRVIIIEKTQTKYLKYREKTVSVIKDFYPQTVIFDSLTYSSELGNSFLTLYLPSTEADRKGFSVYGDFLSMHRNAEILLDSTLGNIFTIKVPVPLNLPFGFRLKVSGFSYNKYNSGFVTYDYSYPNSIVNLTSEEPPVLLAPQDRYYWVNNSTIFSYERGSGSGVFVVNFHCFDPAGDFYIVTQDIDIRFPMNISNGILSGVEYSWQVNKYLSFTSVNDFVRERKFVNDIGYNAILYSEMRTFRTKPY